MGEKKEQNQWNEGAGRENEARLEAFIATLANDVFDLFTKTEDADQTIRTVLAMMGTALHVSRAAVFECGEDDNVVLMTYEWCAGEDAARLKDDSFPKEHWLGWMRAGQEKDIVVYDDCNEEELTEYEANACKKNGIDAMMQCYYYREGQAVGSIYVDSTDGPRAWTEKEKKVVKAVAKIFGVYLYNMRQMQRLEEDRFLLHEIDKNQDFHSYILKEGTYEILHVNASLKERVPDIKPGDICYKVFKKADKPCEDCPIGREDNSKAEIYSVALGTWVVASATDISLSGNRNAVLVCFSDISKARSYHAKIDTLTGLPTEMEFKRQVLEQMEKAPGNYALGLLNLERFGMLSEKKGVELANQVLIEIADLFKERLLDGGLACRYFADTFLTLLKYDEDAELKERIDAFNKVLQEWHENRFDDFEPVYRAGVYPIAPGETDINDMILKASIAKDEVKEDNGCLMFTDEMCERAEREKEIESIMAEALENGEFVVYMQPTVDLKTGKIASAESLVRWHRSPGRMAMPNDFIPLFEKNGFIREMDDFMIEQVCKIIQKWRQEGKPIVPISINIAEKNMRDGKFVAKVKELVKQYKIPPHTLELELREGMFEGEVEELILAINSLRRLGVTFAIDDFGTGASPLNIIRKLPVDVLKMDKDFFDNIHLSEKERAMLTHMIRLAKSIDMKVLYEGIETEGQEEVLKDAGCDLGQGFLYGGPMSEDSFQRLLAAQ